MMRHLVRLTRPVGGTPATLALAVYAEPAGEGWRTQPATDQGFEGVACVDDAARAAIAFLRLQPRGAASERSARIARGLLRFVESMQAGDGRFTNFITDWDGTKNLDGPTSVLGGPWSARAVHGLAVGAAILRDPTFGQAARRGLYALDPSDENLDVHAVSALAALELWRVSGERADADRCRALCEAILTGRHGDALRDNAAIPQIHLWGHLQEMALCEVGTCLRIPTYIEAARRSAEVVLLPALDRLATESAQPFEASCVVAGLAGVAHATGRPRYAIGARLGQAWFVGRNAAETPVYDAHRGVVFDGVDGHRVSENAGAEASIEGANALLGTTVAQQQTAAHRLRRLEPQREVLTQPG
jgi:hypothetical protein